MYTCMAFQKKLMKKMSFLCPHPYIPPKPWDMHVDICIPMSLCSLSLQCRKIHFFGVVWTSFAWGVSKGVHYIAFWQGPPLRVVFWKIVKKGNGFKWFLVDIHDCVQWENKRQEGWVMPRMGCKGMFPHFGEVRESDKIWECYRLLTK